MDRKHRHTGSIGCFGGIHRGNEHGFETGITRGKRHGKRTADRPQLSGEGKLAEEESVVGRCVDLARCRQNGKQNGQIVCCSCLFCVGRCEVDGQSGHRPVKGTGLCGGTDALSGFGYRAGRQTDDIQPGKTAGEEALDGDNVAVNAAQSCGEYARYHADPSDTYGITI